MKLLIKTLSSKELQSKGLSIDRAVFTLPVPDSGTLKVGLIYSPVTILVG